MNVCAVNLISVGKGRQICLFKLISVKAHAFKIVRKWDLLRLPMSETWANGRWMRRHWCDDHEPKIPVKKG